MAIERVIDSLSRIIEIEGEQVDILKELSAAMSAKVNSSSTPSDNPIVAKLQELADKEGARRSDVKDSIEDLPTNIYNLIGDHLNNAEKYLKDISDAVDDMRHIASKSGGGGSGVGGTGGGVPNCSCVAAMETALKNMDPNVSAISTTLSSQLPKIHDVLKQIKGGIGVVTRAMKTMSFGGGGGGGRGGGGGGGKFAGGGMDAALAEARSLLGIADVAGASSAGVSLEELQETIEQFKHGLPGAADVLDTASGANSADLRNLSPDSMIVLRDLLDAAKEKIS
jgi:hypothetical protein